MRLIPLHSFCYLLFSVATVACGNATVFAQAVSPIQARERPNGYATIGPVMTAGSDSRAVAFENKIKPIVLNIVRLNLASGQIFRNPVCSVCAWQNKAGLK